MGYKNSTLRKEESGYAILKNREFIFRNLNVASLGYIVGINSDGSYNIQLSPKVNDLNLQELTIYKALKLDGLTLAVGDIVLVLFLDTPYKKAIEYKPSYDKLKSLVELNDIEKDTLHDYRNAIIIGKVG